MKKLFITVLAVIFAALPSVAVQAESVLLNGQKHYYTVQLRSDKQAIVYARIIFENSSADKDLSTYEFSLPDGVTASNLSIQQILAKSTAKQPCTTYETLEQWRTRANSSGTSYLQKDSAYDSAKQCLVWGTPVTYDADFDYDTNTSTTTDYYYYSYYQKRDTKFDYVDLTQTNTNGSYSVTLSEPIKPKKQASILVSFTTSNFVSGGFLGRYDYNVRTLLAKQMIDTTTVAVNFDTDMYTREATQKRTSETSDAATSLNATQGSTSANYQSKSTDSLVNTIGRGGLYVKSQSALLPGDTLSVTGVFATNQIIMYSAELIVSLLILAALVGAFIVYRKWRKKHPRSTPLKTAKASVDSSVTSSGGKQASVDTPSATPWPRLVLVSGISIVGTIVVTLAVFSASSSIYSAPANIILACGIAITCLLGGLLIPALYVAQYGLKTVFKWALLHLGIIVVLILLFSVISSAEIGYNSTPPSLPEDCIMC